MDPPSDFSCKTCGFDLYTKQLCFSEREVTNCIVTPFCSKQFLYNMRAATCMHLVEATCLLFSSRAVEGFWSFCRIGFRIFCILKSLGSVEAVWLPVTLRKETLPKYRSSLSCLSCWQTMSPAVPSLANLGRWDSDAGTKGNHWAAAHGFVWWSYIFRTELASNPKFGALVESQLTRYKMTPRFQGGIDP